MFLSMRGMPSLRRSRIGQRVICVPVGVVIEIGILADIERAVRAGQEGREIALDVARRGEIFRVLPQRIGLAVLPQILRLERHDLFEMRMAPGAGFGVLEHAAPDRIDQRDGGIQRLPRALDRDGVAGSRRGRSRDPCCRRRCISGSRPSRRACPRRIRRNSWSARRAVPWSRKAEADGLTSKASPTEGPGEGSSIMALSSACIRSGSI